MNLKESYNELYSACQTYNELVAEEERTQKMFSDLEIFLQNNRVEIERYGLEPDICQLFNNKDFSISQIQRLIQKKREEEERQKAEERRRRQEEERRRREQEERERARRAEEERRRREQEERERARREEEERRRREEEERERQRKIELRKKIIKWSLILLSVALVAWVLIRIVIPWIRENYGWVLGGLAVIGFIIYKLTRD